MVCLKPQAESRGSQVSLSLSRRSCLRSCQTTVPGTFSGVDRQSEVSTSATSESLRARTVQTVPYQRPGPGPGSGGRVVVIYPVFNDTFR